jgi:Tfp pilus assembly protein PilF
VLALGWPLAAVAQGRVIDLRATRPPLSNSFEAWWSLYRKARERGDEENANKAIQEIRRLRVERNIRRLEPLALAQLGEGLSLLGQGKLREAAAQVDSALVLDPDLPDAHFARGLVLWREGPLAWLQAVRATLGGYFATQRTVQGRYHAFALVFPVAILAVLVTGVIFAVVSLLRHASLLRHDMEEGLGPARDLALGLHAFVLVLPLVFGQSPAWLPLWWLALLFGYMSRTERATALVVAVSWVALGPALGLLERRVVAQLNPLFRAALATLESGPDARALLTLEEAVAQRPLDRDLVYLLATQYKKAGRYDDATGLYQTLLAQQPKDVYTLNNLGNLAFATGEFQAAIARYKQAIDAAPPAPALATAYYNLSLAHLQRFEYQPNQEARSHAERLARDLVRAHESWRYDRGDYAVVDLVLTPDELGAKFEGSPAGSARENVAGQGRPRLSVADLVPGLLTPLTLVVGAFPLVVLVVSFWRGSKSFTRACVKCGTAFCRRCHLGTSLYGLCTQCHHLFVVRDGVSGPARNQKLLEVQREDVRRERIFRLLSLLVPGSGHLYAHRTLAGAAFVCLWSFVLALALLGGRVIPLTEAPSSLSRPWGLGLLGLCVLVIYVVANRAKADVEVLMPVGKVGARRGRG